MNISKFYSIMGVIVTLGVPVVISIVYDNYRRWKDRSASPQSGVSRPQTVSGEASTKQVTIQ